ncbi:MAG TPA: translation initiation factor IF-1, partial [Rhodospirillum rubrum]|nr:translation initiation factor IF-1 [Rhodospirillum rubrum]
MAKEELIEMDGVVTDVLPDSRFKVQLDTVSYTHL